MVKGASPWRHEPSLAQAWTPSTAKGKLTKGKLRQGHIRLCGDLQRQHGHAAPSVHRHSRPLLPQRPRLSYICDSVVQLQCLLRTQRPQHGKGKSWPKKTRVNLHQQEVPGGRAWDRVTAVLLAFGTVPSRWYSPTHTFFTHAHTHTYTQAYTHARTHIHTPIPHHIYPLLLLFCFLKRL